MSFVPGRSRLMTGFIIAACAIVCACGKPDASDTTSSPPISAAASEAPAAPETSELQDWARQATGDASGRPAQAGIARASSDALATPVIHTVD